MSIKTDVDDGYPFVQWSTYDMENPPTEPDAVHRIMTNSILSITFDDTGKLFEIRVNTPVRAVFDATRQLAQKDPSLFQGTDQILVHDSDSMKEVDFGGYNSISKTPDLLRKLGIILEIPENEMAQLLRQVKKLDKNNALGL